MPFTVSLTFLCLSPLAVAAWEAALHRPAPRPKAGVELGTPGCSAARGPSSPAKLFQAEIHTIFT